MDAGETRPSPLASVQVGAWPSRAPPSFLRPSPRDPRTPRPHAPIPGPSRAQLEELNKEFKEHNRADFEVRREKGGCALKRRGESPDAQETGGVAMP